MIDLYHRGYVGRAVFEKGNPFLTPEDRGRLLTDIMDMYITEIEEDKRVTERDTSGEYYEGKIYTNGRFYTLGGFEGRYFSAIVETDEGKSSISCLVTLIDKPINPELNPSETLKSSPIYANQTPATRIARANMQYNKIALLKEISWYKGQDL